MAQFKFYDVDKDYITYLQSAESKVPNIAYAKNDKFICGILFAIHGKNYYAPISSFSKQQKTNILIKNSTGRITSSIRLSFMFPVPPQLVAVKDFSRETSHYKRLLMDELGYCNRNADKIISKAQYIYESVISGANPDMAKNCCNFQKLELAYTQYCLTHQLPLPQIPTAVAYHEQSEEYDLEP